MYKRNLGALLLTLLAVTAIAAAAAGCGGSDSTSGGDTAGSTAESTDSQSTEAEGTEAEEGSGGAAPTKAQFVKEADQICAEADGALNGEIADFAKENDIPITKEEPNQQQKVELYEAVVIPSVARERDEIGELTPPEGDEGTIEELLSSLDSGIEEAEADPGALAEGDNPLEDASSKAKAYGLNTCGQ